MSTDSTNARKWYQFVTHNAEGAFSGKRTAGFAAGAVVAAGAAYSLTRSQDRAAYEGTPGPSV